jgi:hypothetical protein
MHERRFGWKTVRVLHRRQLHGTMMDALHRLHVARSPVVVLFYFPRSDLCAADPLIHRWRDGNGHDARLI